MSKIFPSKGCSSRRLTRRERLHLNLWQYQQNASRALLKAAVAYGDALTAGSDSDISIALARMVRAYKRYIDLGMNK